MFKWSLELKGADIVWISPFLVLRIWVLYVEISKIIFKLFLRVDDEVNETEKLAETKVLLFLNKNQSSWIAIVNNEEVMKFLNCPGEVYKWQIFIQNFWDEFGRPKRYTLKTTF